MTTLPYRFTVLLITMLFIATANFANSSDFHSSDSKVNTDKVVKTPTDGGIVENIPEQYKLRYEKWKSEFLSTEFGRQEWDKYSNNKNFTLTITVSKKENQGAGTGDYLWNDHGELVGSTITLGWKLDKGFPNPVYFPVMNSISDFNIPGEINNETLAATKFMHEFGHVKMTQNTNRNVFVLQNKLIPDYNKILLTNGYDVKDPRLVELADKMGGTPVEIWENREYWGETNAMNFLLEKVKNTNYFCSILKKINHNVDTFAVGYKERFVEVARTKADQGCRK